MPGLLSDAEMAAIRATAQSSFDLTATQQRVSDDGWGTVVGPTTIATWPCRLGTPTGPLLTMLAAQIGAVSVWVVTCSNDVDLKVGDLLLIGSDTLRVNSILEPTSYNTAQRAMVTEVN